MVQVLANRVALIAAATVIAGGAATALAVAFPGRAEPPPVAAAPVPVAAPDVPIPTAAPTPSVTPSPVPTSAPQVVYAPRRSTTVRAQPTRRPSGGGGGDVSQLPGPAQKAVGDPPAQPEQPEQPPR